MNDNALFTSSVIDLSEEQDYLTLRNKICFFNDKNLNNVQMDYDESTQEQCKSLINMPVVARYVKRNGKDDLGGHEVSVINGKVKFGTATIGVVTGIEIKNEDVETVTGEVKNLPVLYADERVWTRNENATNAIKRLYLEGKLHSSWEVKSSEYLFKENVKHLVKYAFLSNCLLGTMSYPAYGKGGAAVVEMSEQSDNYEYLAAEAILGEALALDVESASASNINQLDDTNRKEGLSMDNENVVVETSEEETKEETVEVVNTEETAEVNVEEEVTNEDTSVSEGDPAPVEEQSATEQSEAETDEAEGNEEVSAMKTDHDIYKMIRDAINAQDSEDYYEISMLFPEEKIVLVHSWRMRTLEYIQYSYRIDGDKAVLDNEKKVELTISPLRVNSELEKKNNAIAEANERIVALESQVAELNKAKEELDTIKAEKANAEHAEAVEKLRSYVINSGRFTQEELDSSEVKDAIENLNEAWIKSEIADRLVASMSKEKKVETSEVKDNKNIGIVLSESTEDNKSASPEDVMRAFFNN